MSGWSVKRAATRWHRSQPLADLRRLKPKEPVVAKRDGGVAGETKEASASNGMQNLCSFFQRVNTIKEMQNAAKTHVGRELVGLRLWILVSLSLSD